MKKANYLILPLLFFGFIYFMFLNQIFGWTAFKNNSENRSLAKFPAFNINKLDKYPEKYDAYLNDNFTFRALFLDAYHETKFQMGISPNAENVLIGSNGHFFLADLDQEVYEGQHYFDEKDLASLENVWKQKRDFLSKRNIPFYWLIAPNKHHVYADELPMGIYEKKKNRSLLVKGFLDKKFPNKIIYPLPTLIAHKEFAYFKQDTHWSEEGAYYSYLELMKTMKKENVSLKHITPKQIHWKVETRTTGNLLNYLGKEGELSEIVHKAKIKGYAAQKAQLFNFKAPKDFPYPWEYEYHFINKKALNKKRVLIIRDSYGVSIMPFLNYTFSETLYIYDNWKYAINKEIVDTYKPDLIIFLTLETNLKNIIEKAQIIEKEE